MDFIKEEVKSSNTEWNQEKHVLMVWGGLKFYLIFTNFSYRKK